MAKFDGRTSVTLPESLVSSDSFPSHKFTIATWVRHRHNKALDKHTKEHIICKADDHRKLLTARPEGRRPKALYICFFFLETVKGESNTFDRY